MVSVLHLINYIGSGGAEKYIISLARALKDKECSFYVGVSKRTHNKFEKELESLGVKIVLLPIRSIYDIGSAITIVKFCKTEKIDVIHTHFLRENCISVFTRLLGNRAKIINTCHMNWKNRKDVQILNRIITRLNYKVIAVSASVKEILESEGVQSEKIELIYNGVDYNYFKQSIQSTIDEEFNIGKNVFKISTIARFNEEKGHFYLLDIIKELGRKVDLDKFKFILVGDGELKQDVKRYAVDNNIDRHIIFTGLRSDIKNILDGVDLYISPSKNEALGLSILEAMACGVPVIATNVGGTPEIVGHNYWGLINYGDKQCAVSKILEMYQNKDIIKEKLGEFGKNRIKSIFNLETMAQKTYNLYEKAR